jgi:Uma2 family endonuclease
MDVDEPGWTRIQPNWVCEVLSPKHEKRDLVDKLATLQRVGVAHYWIVDATARILQVYRHEPRGYLLVASAGSGETIRAEPFDAVELRTAVIFGDDDDDD